MRFIIVLTLLLASYLTHAQDKKNDLLNRIDTLMIHSEFDSCINIIHKKASIALLEKDTLFYIKLKIKETSIYYQNLDVDKSIPENLDLYKKYNQFLLRNDPTLLYKICNFLGADYSYLGDQSNAISFLLKAKKLKETYGVKDDNVYVNLYQYYIDNANYINAFKEINIYQKNCITKKDTIGLGNSHFSIGKIYQYLSDYDKALSNYKKSLTYYESKNQKQFYFRALNGIANCFFLQKKYDSSVFYYEKCLKLELSDDNYGLCLINLISSHLALDQLKKAEFYINQFTEKKINYKNFINDYHDVLADYYMKKGEFNKAIQLLKKSIGNKGMSTLKDLAIQQRTLSTLYKNTGKYDSAYYFLQNSTILLDSINKSKISVLDSIAINYVEAENNFTLLKQKNEIIKQENTIQKRTLYSILLLFILLSLSIISFLIFKKLQKDKNKIKKLADEEKENYDTFKYTISHDLNRPLSNVLKIVDEYEHTPSVSLNTSEIKSQLTDAQNLISNLLIFTNIEQAKLYHSDFNIVDLITKLINQISGEHKNYSFKKEINLDVSDTNIIGDKFLLKQVFINIYENAIKYSQNVVNPNIITKIDSNNDTIQILISDNGIGIKPELEDEIFQIFTKGHNNTNIPGHGIGLSIVKKIIDKHNGQVKAYSNNYGGASIEINLPKKIKLDLA